MAVWLPFPFPFSFPFSFSFSSSFSFSPDFSPFVFAVASIYLDLGGWGKSKGVEINLTRPRPRRHLARDWQ